MDPLLILNIQILDLEEFGIHLLDITMLQHHQ
nr:MAG TPA: hypothetical protein [Caudoviricetes sp.]DAX04679.1 MAG TPA: hypothetical protein [Bacteriophage sp.]